MTRERRWLLAAAALCTTALAGPPPAPGTTHPPPPQHESPAPGVPDDEFIEFLGADDMGDEAWLEFLKNAPPRAESPHAAPPREANQ